MSPTVTRISLFVAAMACAVVADASDDEWLTRTTRVVVEVEGPVDAEAVRGLVAAELGPSCVVIGPEATDNSTTDVEEAVTEEVAAVEGDNSEEAESTQQSATSSGVDETEAGTSSESAPSVIDDAEQSADEPVVEDLGDKIVRVKVVAEGGQFRVKAVENDVWLHDEGLPQTAVVDSEALLVAEAARLAVRAFRARVLLRSGDDGITGTPFGGAMFGSKPLVKPGDLLRPVLRFRDRDDIWKETKPIAWTYLRVTDGDPMALKFDVVSAFAAPLPGRIRRGEVVGLVERATHETTDVVVVGDADRRPRAGLKVEVRPGRKAEMDGETPKPPLFEDLSDRRGLVHLPALEQDVVWVSVQSTTTLANVPIRPGYGRKVMLPVQEDRERVGLDERLEAIELKLTDLAARKAVHVARLKAAAKAEEWNKVDLAFQELDKLPDAEDLIVDVNAARVEAVLAAEKRGDRVQAARLKKHADVLEQTIAAFADPAADKELRDELRSIREIADETKKVTGGK